MNLLDLIFPKTCLGCRKEGKYLCNNCLAKVKILSPACPYCEKASIDGFTHVKCRKKYGLDGLTSIWDYDGVIKKAIMALKYKYSTEVGKELSECLVSYLKIQNSLFMIRNSSVLVPIPIHWHKENVRGFNQSVEIGRIVAGQMGWKLNPELLIKTRSTSSQAGLSVEKRKQNLKDVFAIAQHNSLFMIPDSVVLFDDVFTTGSTLKEAAKVLKRAGVEKVWGLTIAR
jgi:ComF family protein